jgi:DNA-binding HxlR family transcriptional regulator
MNGFLISYSLRLKHTLKHPISSTPNDYSDILEAVRNNKQLQIDNINHKVNDIQIKLDLIESILSQLQRSNNTNIIKSAQNITAIPNVTSPITSISETSDKLYHKTSQINPKNNISNNLTDKQNVTNYYILKVLLKKSLTSNEIKNAIGRTREHTARVMKKLYELKFVDRDTTTKPFKYKLTEQGKKFIEEHIEKNGLSVIP